MIQAKDIKLRHQKRRQTGHTQRSVSLLGGALAIELGAGGRTRALNPRCLSRHFAVSARHFVCGLELERLV